MSRTSFATSPSARGTQRKFINPTQGYVGANVFGPDGKPTAVPVEPGGEIWLTEEEERMTAEAPRHPNDNPFIKQWEEPVEWDGFGEAVRTVTREGVLVLSEEPPRPIASQRFIPPREEPSGAAKLNTNQPQTIVAEGNEFEQTNGDTVTVTGTDELPKQPPVQGQPSENEVLGTPEAPDQNDEALAHREPTAEQPTILADDEEPLPV